MKHYTELFLGLILAGVLLITLGFLLVSSPGAFGSREAGSLRPLPTDRLGIPILSSLRRAGTGHHGLTAAKVKSASNVA